MRIYLDLTDITSADELVQLLALEVERTAVKHPETANMLSCVANQIIDQIADKALGAGA